MKKYINAIANMVLDKQSLIPDGALFFVHTIEADKKNPSKLAPFRCYCEVNIIGTSGGNNKDNPIDGKKVLQFKVRMTKISDKKEEQLCIDLNDFSIDCSNEAFIEKDNSLKFINHRVLIDVPALNCVPGKGKYSLRVLVKENTEEKYEVQSTTIFNIV